MGSQRSVTITHENITRVRFVSHRAIPSRHIQAQQKLKLVNSEV